jgi:hypothetical protein
VRILPTMFLGACGLFVIGGCSEETGPADEQPASGTVSLTEAEIQTLTEKQKVCVVTGEPLGSMGTPVPVRVSDSAGSSHTVLLCCDSCREELLSDPESYLAKLASAKPIARTP